MVQHGVPLVALLLPITIVLQIGGGLLLIVGIRVRDVALVLAGLTLVINLGMHDFWNTYPNTDSGHELQNFVKNLGIFAGLLVLASTQSLNQWKLNRA
jgi:putative oxidoreductase